MAELDPNLNAEGLVPITSNVRVAVRDAVLEYGHEWGVSGHEAAARLIETGLKHLVECVAE